MLMFWQNQAALVLTVAVFVALLLFMEGLYLLWRSYRGPEARKINQRLVQLGSSATRQQALLRESALSTSPLLGAWLQDLPGREPLNRLLVQADLRWTLAQWLLGSAALGLLGYWLSAVLLHQAWVFGLLCAAALGSLPLAYVSWRRAQRLTQLEQQLPEALDLMGRALLAGHAFSSALQMVGDEMAEPMAGQFRVVHDEINFGVSLHQAFIHLTERVPITDLRYFVVAVLIQRESGGNLADVLTQLAQLIRARLRLHAKVRVLSSEGRLSAWILGFMPFAMAGLMSVLNPDFMTPLWTDPIGLTILKYLLVMMAVGALLLRKIVRIRV